MLHPTTQIMARRLSRSAPLLQYNALQASIRQLNTDLEAFEKLKEKDRDERVREAKTTQLEADRAALAESEAAMAALKASFAEDPLSLVPWMNVLFDLADAGMTTFDLSAPFFPHTNLTALFGGGPTSGPAGASAYQGIEQVLGTFKRRQAYLEHLNTAKSARLRKEHLQLQRS
jgi:hypothetical protein